VQSLWVRNLSSAHPEASPCLSGMLCHSEDATPPWWLCRNIVQSSKQYFSHCIYCVYAQACGVCLFSTSGVWVDLSQPSHLQFFFSFYEGRTFKKEIYMIMYYYRYFPFGLKFASGICELHTLLQSICMFRSQVVKVRDHITNSNDRYIAVSMKKDLCSNILYIYSCELIRSKWNLSNWKLPGAG
jgi:hypothetical protein